MANYNCTYRTNYFRVTDEARYKKLISNLSGEDIECFEGDEHPGLHGFGGFGSLGYRDVPTVKEWMSRPEHEKPAVFFEETCVNGEWLLVPIPDPDPEVLGELYVYEAIEKYDENEIHVCKKKSDVILDDDCMIEFYQELQKILPDDEAMILMESGNEKLHYVTGFITVVTSKDIKFANMTDIALETARAMLGTDFTTQLDY